MAPKDADAHGVVLPTLEEKNAARERRSPDTLDWERIARKRARVLEYVYLDYDVPQEFQRLAPDPSLRISKRAWEVELLVWRTNLCRHLGYPASILRPTTTSSSIGPPPGLGVPGDPPGLEAPGDVEVHAPPVPGHAASSSPTGPPPGLEVPGEVEARAPPVPGHAASSSSIGPPPGLEVPGDVEVHDPTGPGPAASSSSTGPAPGLEVPGDVEVHDPTGPEHWPLARLRLALLLGSKFPGADEV